MAKWGEGDPRWIVEERADAKNVNNWHWTEKNASPWSKEKIKALLGGLEIENEQAKIKVTDVTKVDGEATANNRKAKLIFFYEWVISLEWSGTLSGSENILKGKVEIPNFSEEHTPSEVDVLVTTKSNSDEAYKLKDIMRKHGAQIIREKLSQYINDLRNEFSQGLILPTKNQSPVNTPAQVSCTKKEFQKMTVSGGKKDNKEENQLGCRIFTKKFTSSEEFRLSAEDLYSFLTQKELLEAFTRSNATVDATKGGSFVLFGGNVVGKFMELVRGEKIVMEWRFKDWHEGHHSNVTILFKQKDDSTELKLTQTGIPESDFERTKTGWEKNYWQAIKKTCGLIFPG